MKFERYGGNNDVMGSKVHHEEEEIMNQIKMEVIELAPAGLGFGEGSIGVQNRLGDEHDALSTDDLLSVREIIHSGEALVPIDTDENGRLIDDDGCPDGRGVGRIEQAGHSLNRSLNRAKVFGGSATIMAAARIGIGEAKEQNQSDLFETVCDQLDKSGIDYGAHSSDHCGEGESGCGAIDKFKDHLLSSEKYRKQISRAAFEVARASGFNEGKDERQVGAMIDSSQDNLREYSHSFKPDKGSKILQTINSRLKVIKALIHNHNEVRIAINLVPEHTIDQELVRQCTGGRAQVFAVDAWRMLDVIDRNEFIPEDKKEQAFISELIYSLSVAATLTRGDLPVDLILPTENG